MLSVKERFTNFIHSLQDEICSALEKEDGQAKFHEDKWERPEGGGGKTRIIEDGNVFEKGGVNTSIVHGKLNPAAQEALKIRHADFFACGLSMVIHPINPYVPTFHANIRYFELYDESGNLADSWFGGGSDLTPYYIFKEDGKHFHQTLKDAMDPFGAELYPRYKKACDEYFVNKHRENEARGIGGVFYDYLKPQSEWNNDKLLAFQEANGNAILKAYLPIVQKRKELVFGEDERFWQGIRRGRYVEFNLVHDRGTIFGLKTNGRTESILMSLPKTARWEYDYHPEAGSREAELLSYLKPQDWINL
jgi:coproporphyrinogen III oxidase